ncbi:MAG: aminomethyl-transferring glycine dehydrogenase subunit GcvPB [Clostridiales Family XIII bacterium]|jgi:glycine dehydrogenase subunit 2|nr:aminomethyl-transferring glycine dehydrogenase subunit GcvPB [Clostridiales Family XIII bacterium]
MHSRYDKLIFELSSEGKEGYRFPETGVDNADALVSLPAGMLRTDELSLPRVSEPEVVRHYTLLSQKNYGVDGGFYPLGSCTMKYNPKINEDVCGLEAFTGLHPYQAEESAQGALELMYELGAMLAEITGMARFSLQPAAGAHGELAGLMIFKKWHEGRGDGKRNKILVPDSSHGTNPASAAAAGFEIVTIASNSSGTVDTGALRLALADDVAGLMLTNPNTLGLFETEIREIADLVHEAGGLLYYDGANLNAIMGKARPGDMGFDVVHVNTHKTFSTPHGGGGPGAGPIGVAARLEGYLPGPVVVKDGAVYRLAPAGEDSIGKIRGYYGSFGVLARAYAYIRTMGAEGLTAASETAVLNANYLKELLKGKYRLPYDRVCMHEFVLDGLIEAAEGVATLDVAKRLMDFGYHPPTIYFPLIVPNALMIEPTETESKDTLDGFADALLKIADEAICEPQTLHEAPRDTPVRRVDETRAARQPVLRWEQPVEKEAE